MIEPDPTEAAVGISGKDSLVALDICQKNLARVEPWTWFLVEGLEYQEDYWRTIEHRFGVTIRRIPDFRLPNFLRFGTFNPPGHKVNAAFTRELVFKDGIAAVRRECGVDFIAMGIKSHDSPLRRIELRFKDVVKHPKLGAINTRLKRIYPCAWLTDKDVFSYVKHHKLPLSPEYSILAGAEAKVATFHNFTPAAMWHLKKGISASDWSKIVDTFPFIEAAVAHYDYFGPDKRKSYGKSG